MARALYSSYTGPLYQVQKASDKSTKDIMVGTDGFAKSSDQDSRSSTTNPGTQITFGLRSGRIG
jgi:hypothetical protein